MKAKLTVDKSELYKMIIERMKTPKEEYVNGEAVLKRLKLSLDD